jgi:integrase
MATLRKRGTKWQVQVRRNGFPAASKTFHLKEDAVRWGRQQEHRIDTGKPVKLALASPEAELKLADLLERYRLEVLPRKRAAGPIEAFHLRALQRHSIAQIALSKLTSPCIAAYRDDRTRKVSSSTILRELGLLFHSLRVARREWGLPVPEIEKIAKPTPNKARERRLSNGELAALNAALEGCRNKLVKPVFLFAIATGMRRSEILSLRWADVDLEKRTAFLPITKNAHSRTVPLSASAAAILERQTSAVPRRDKCFPISSNAFRLGWERVKRRANVQDLHFHDLRHEAISRFFEMGLSVPEVSLISGHKDARMLFRYTHLKAERVAQKLQSLDSGLGTHPPTDNAM